MSKKQEVQVIDFENEDGTVDEWTYKNGRAVKVVLNIKRRT